MMVRKFQSCFFIQKSLESVLTLPVGVFHPEWAVAFTIAIQLIATRFVVTVVVRAMNGTSTHLCFSCCCVGLIFDYTLIIIFYVPKSTWKIQKK